MRWSELAERVSTDPLLGWGEYALGGVSLHWVSGSHETMLAAEHAPALGAEMRLTLETARLTQVR